MNDLSELLTGAVAADVRATNGHDLAEAMRSGTRRRVRVRRGARAAGVGSVAAVSVGAVAFGVARLPGVGEMQPAGGASVEECPPGTVAVQVVEDPVEPGSASVPDDLDDLPDPEGTFHLVPGSGKQVIIDGEVVEEFEIEVVIPGSPAPVASDPVTVCVTPTPDVDPSPDMSELEVPLDDAAVDDAAAEEPQQDSDGSPSPSPSPSNDVVFQDPDDVVSTSPAAPEPSFAP